MRAPFELGCSPSPASMTPAFTISSLNFIIADMSFSSGITPASELLSAGTRTMNRIVVLLLCGRGGLQNPVSWGRRRGDGRIDIRDELFSIMLEAAVRGDPATAVRSRAAGFRARFPRERARHAPC